MTTTKARVTAIAFSLLALFVSTGLCFLFVDAHHVHAQQKQDATLKELLTNRLAVLKTIAATYAEIQKDNVGNFQLAYDADRAVLFAELDLCETENDRIAILERIVALTKEHEQTALKQEKDGILPKIVALKATVERLDAEITLKRAKSK